jgi:ketosteroid isomerase-like protein
MSNGLSSSNPSDLNQDDRLRAFFESYRSAWERRDIDEILAMYDRPLMTLRLDGTLHCLHDETELRRVFVAALDRYVATGYETLELTVDNIVMAGQTATLVAVTWTLRSAPDVVVMKFRQTYNVRTTPDGWKIYASTQHIE